MGESGRTTGNKSHALCVDCGKKLNYYRYEVKNEPRCMECSCKYYGRHYWTDKEIDILTKVYPSGGFNAAKDALKLKDSVIRNEVTHLGLKVNKGRRIDKLQLEYIANLYKWGHTPREISKLIGISMSPIHKRLKLLNIKKRDNGSGLRGKKITDKKLLKKLSKLRKIQRNTPEYHEKHSGVNSPSYGRHMKPESVALMRAHLIGSRAGDKSPHWVGGKLAHGRYSREFYRRRNSVREEDGYKCRICGKEESNLKSKLCVHHIDYNKNNIERSNLISLCRSCHAKTNFNRDVWKQYFAIIIGPTNIKAEIN